MKSILNKKFKLIVTPQSASLPGKMVLESSDLFPTYSQKVKVDNAEGVVEIAEPPGGMHTSLGCSAVGPLKASPPVPPGQFAPVKGEATKVEFDNGKPVLDDLTIDCKCTGTYIPPGSPSPAPFNGACQIKALFAGQAKVTAK
ncbi:hypothetical protein [Aureibacter tunicatorum]|uniref:Uncharacterized protein n=1 Tax=Aureibacter tunicatorum TaxID=866807 RepID=A0AAE3XTR4_9BACT|nr:hypothetical protein [Aureibacter tunicatorum]MDR6241898.1 hypothetical protein [Aureibacter tunicatorum]BDD07447.1 hypothetical protein AUTU_49300 [Aureibacter tunicatorum]